MSLGEQPNQSVSDQLGLAGDPVADGLFDRVTDFCVAGGMLGGDGALLDSPSFFGKKIEVVADNVAQGRR